MNTSPELHIKLREIILAIETTVSLVGVDDTNHGKRVGYIACQIGHQLGYSQQDLEFLFELGMLHDMGVSSNHVHQQLVFNFDWEQANIHCEIGYLLLSHFTPLAHFATPVLYHHTAWQELQGLQLKPRDIRMANLIYLADRIDVLGAAHYGSDILLANKQIVEQISAKANHYFAPEFVAAFVKVQQSESFWIALEDRHIIRYVWDMGKSQTQSSITLKQLKQLARIMAYIVDQKSPFTAAHSSKVAEVAKYIAQQFGMNPVQSDMIEVAGYLHDLGKLRTPDEILDKPGPLNDLERAIINQHSFETYEILRHISGLEEISRWAAFHHEGLNGCGYPFHPTEKELSTEARIVAVADVFQALVQDRPYRHGMSLSQALLTIDEMAHSNKLDNVLVNLVHQHQQQCFQIATGKVNTHQPFSLDAMSTPLKT